MPARNVFLKCEHLQNAAEKRNQWNSNEICCFQEKYKQNATLFSLSECVCSTKRKNKPTKFTL